MYFFKHSLSLILAFLLGLQLCLPASAQTQSPLLSFSQTTDQVKSTDYDYWLETGIAMAGSAAGNGATLLSVLLLDFIPPILGVTTSDKSNWVNTDSPFLAFYLLLPILAMPLALHLFYPLPEGIEVNYWQTLLASLGSVLLHTALMIPVFLAMQQPSFNQNFYLVVPIAFFSAIVLEGMATAWVFDQSRTLSLQQADSGLKVVYRLSF
jgi:hypothetical protein